MWLIQHFPGHAFGVIEFCFGVACVQVVLWMIDLAWVQHERRQRRRLR